LAGESTGGNWNDTQAVAVPAPKNAVDVAAM